jgi:hypothetical protein
MSTGRRSFLRRLGGLAGANVVVGSATSQTSSSLTGRAGQALAIRVNCAQNQSQRAAATGVTNGDEARYPNFIANYTKGLPHSELGEVQLDAYQSLLHAVTTQKYSDAEKIILGFPRKLVNIGSAFSFDLDGGDPQTFELPPPPAFASSQMAAEMVELYWQALARDIPFSQWDSSAIVQTAASELNNLSGYQGPRDASGQVTTANVFRGIQNGSTTGPYLSQYFLKTIYFGSTPREQMYRTGLPGTDYITDYSGWVLAQSGLPPYTEELFDANFRYIRSGRDLAQFVHYDYTYQAFLQAALIIFDQHPETVLNFNTYQLNHTNPYKSSRIQTGFTTFGAAHVQDWVARAANLVLKPACWHKWAVHRRIRPEAFGGRVFNTLSGAASYPIHTDLLNSQALRGIVNATGGALLPQAYVEGSPLHPSYPAGHAAIAGACATILKAFFEETDLVSGTVTAAADGLSLAPYDDQALTIGGELNKLAFNIIMGRNFAGIHYRSDADAGLALGEAVAIAFMQDQVNTFSEGFPGFQFTKFDGTPVSITQG